MNLTENNDTAGENTHFPIYLKITKFHCSHSRSSILKTIHLKCKHLRSKLTHTHISVERREAKARCYLARRCSAVALLTGRRSAPTCSPGSAGTPPAFPETRGGSCIAVWRNTKWFIQKRSVEGENKLLTHRAALEPERGFVLRNHFQAEDLVTRRASEKIPVNTGRNVGVVCIAPPLVTLMTWPQSWDHQESESAFLAKYVRIQGICQADVEQ